MPSYSPQSNGVVERKNCTLMDIVNVILLNSCALENLEKQYYHVTY